MMLSFLALGDSYTIGEGVPLYESYPYQTMQLLRRAGKVFQAPEIIARTGWTADELLTALDNTCLLPQYDLVTLLIGVNNQYRGRGADEFGVQFETLLTRAMERSTRVIVLSIPDWGVSPFAASCGRDPSRISQEIDVFNTIAASLARRKRVPFIDITPHSRTSTVFTADGLHPAAETYSHWAQQVAAHLAGSLPASGQ